MKNLFIIFLSITIFGINLQAQKISEYVYTNHYTYKCAYCKQIKKEDKVDLTTIKDPQIYNNAMQYGILSGVLYNSGYEEKKYCDISRSGEHRYELINKTRTSKLFSRDINSVTNDTNDNDTNDNSEYEEIKEYQKILYNYFLDYNKKYSKDRKIIKNISQREADMISNKYNYKSWNNLNEETRLKEINKILDTYNLSNRLRENYDEASKVGADGWKAYERGDIDEAILLTFKSISLNDSIGFTLSNKAFFELIKDINKNFNNADEFTTIDFSKYKFWESYFKFAMITKSYNDLNSAQLTFNAAIEDLNDLMSITSQSKKLSIGAIRIAIYIINMYKKEVDEMLESNKNGTN
jgi:hypothetical protein